MTLLAGLELADGPEPWRRLGFTIEGDRCRIGATSLRLKGAAAGEGMLAWTLAGAGPDKLDGLTTTWVKAPRGTAARAFHANGATHIDHIVVMTPDLERTFAALRDAGFDLRRVRDAGSAERPLRQGFYRLGETLLEVVGSPQPAGDGPAALWGLVVVVDDIDACAASLGEDLGTVREAVQPGRRIATVRRTSGVTVPLAFITPPSTSTSP